MEKMSSIESGIMTWNSFEGLKNDRQVARDIIQKCQIELDNISNIT